MTGESSVKAAGTTKCQIVGVIGSPEELTFATGMAMPPDLFELRLDRLVGSENEVETALEDLKAPLIITARHPSEGGANNLALSRRRELLARFAGRAQYVDFELRSAETLHSVLAPTTSLRRVISLHDLGSTPSPRSLHAKARAAKSYGASIFKVATRTDTPAQLARLFEFVANHETDLPISVMGMGHLGEVSRVALARCGSALAYGALRKPQVDGQLTVEQLRAAFALFHIR